MITLKCGLVSATLYNFLQLSGLRLVTAGIDSNHHVASVSSIVPTLKLAMPAPHLKRAVLLDRAVSLHF